MDFYYGADTFHRLTIDLIIMWFLVVSLVSCVVLAQGQTNYCDSKLCGGAVHIGCNNNGAFSTTCLAGREIVDITSFQSTILNKHNTYRNQVAGGNLPGFQPAVQMATTQWGAELAKLAELNVKQCAMKHDQCRNTVNFKYSGQNLASRWGIPAPTAQVTITLGIDSWFNEYKVATQANMDSFPTNPAGVIGHFTGMINDRNTRVGCALLKQPRDGGMQFYFACNYAQTNILGKPVYVKGPAASKCTTGKNPAFPNLCSISEPINPNYIP